MLLEELQIDGFRSLKSVTWKPGRLNVLIGPNGGGKSNLLRALELLRSSANGLLRKLIVAQGGMASISWNGASAIRFLLRTAPDTIGHSLIYDFELDRMATLYGIVSERLAESDGTVLLQSSPNDAGPETVLSDTRAGNDVPSKIFQTFLREWSIYRDMHVDARSQVRDAAVTRYETRVDPDGQNLVPVLHTLYESDREFEDDVDAAMSAAFPGDYEKLKFQAAAQGKIQLGVRRVSGRVDTAADLSDGTLRFLRLLAILRAPDPAPLIAIEEPETGLHPRMLSIIAEVAANAAINSQVILTTHSPKLLDAFSEDLPTTTIVTTNGSETEMKTVGGEDLKRWVENYSLGKFAFSGEAEAVL